MENNIQDFIQSNSPDGILKHTLQGKDFLQSEEWRKFQESAGRRTFHISSLNLPHPRLPKPGTGGQARPLLEGEGDFEFWANVIEHQLPVVGKYFYVPRGPVIQSSAFPFPDNSGNSSRPQRLSVAMAGAAKPSFFYNSFSELIELAWKNNVGWVRIEPANNEVLDVIRKNINKVEPFSVQGSTLKIKKAPHDMQPREILVMDIKKSEEELLAEMKPKTRYNIRLAQKHKVFINVIPAKAGIQKDPLDSGSGAGMTDYIEEFIRLVKITAKRDKITSHPENYYRKMFSLGSILSQVLRITAKY